MKKTILVFTCEHAVNTIPDAFAHHYNELKGLINTHRGIDFGAEAIAMHMSQSMKAELFKANISRLLIDCNRTLNKPGCFTEISDSFSTEEKELLIHQYYLPFRQKVEQCIQAHIANGIQVWHLSIHSFTPSLHGVLRETDIGLLYDPKRPTEKAIARAWQRLMKAKTNECRIRLNYPYKGISDGFTTYFRKKFNNSCYVGIEVESNQALTQSKESLPGLITLLDKTLHLLMENITNQL